MKTYHWHIRFYTESGYPVIDTVPFSSKEAAQNAITQLAWAKYERPKPVRMGLCHCGY